MSITVITTQSVKCTETSIKLEINSWLDIFFVFSLVTICLLFIRKVKSKFKLRFKMRGKVEFNSNGEDDKLDFLK
jgi:hypothetical protein